MATTAETSARRVKADRLADAFAKLAAPASDVPATAGDVLAFAEDATDAVWTQAEALGGTRPASAETRAVVLNLLARAVDPVSDEDLFKAFE